MSDNLENNSHSLDFTNVLDEEQTNTNQQPGQQAQEPVPSNLILQAQEPA